MKQNEFKRELTRAVNALIYETNGSPMKLYKKIVELNEIFKEDVKKEAVSLKSYNEMVAKKSFNDLQHEFNYLAKALRDKILDKPFGVARWEPCNSPIAPQGYLSACSSNYWQQEGPILKDVYKRVFQFFGIPEFSSITLTSYNWKYELNDFFIKKYLFENEIKAAKRDSDTYTRIIFPKFKDEKRIDFESFIKLFENQYKAPEYKEVVNAIRKNKFEYFYESNESNGWTEHELVEKIVDIDSFDEEVVELRIVGFNIVIKTRIKKVVDLYKTVGE